MRHRPAVAFWLAAALALTVLPGAATADHLDEPDDTVRVDYVQVGTPSVCQQPVTPTPVDVPNIHEPGIEQTQEDAEHEVREIVPSLHIVPPVAYESFCVYPRLGTYALTVTGEEGEPAPFRWFVDQSTAAYNTPDCIPPSKATGTVEFTIQRRTCTDLHVSPTDAAPPTGLITVEKLD